MCFKKVLKLIDVYGSDNLKEVGTIFNHLFGISEFNSLSGMQGNGGAISIAVTDGVKLTLFSDHKYPLDHFSCFHLSLLSIFSASDQLGAVKYGDLSWIHFLIRNQFEGGFSP